MPRFDEAAYLRLIRSTTRSPIELAARGGLRAISVPYGWAMRVRNMAFDRGWKAHHLAGVPVVAIGNITLGGTGKTPMVEWVARFFRSHQKRVAILSRGYGQAEGINDEGRVLEENLPDVPHFQGADRVSMARVAVEECESEILVLDDGFQHRRMGRNLDIVLVDALDPFGLRRMFPRGLLREPISSLGRAGVVVLSRADLITLDDRRRIRREAMHHAGPLRWVEARHAPRDLIDASGQSYPIDAVAGRNVAAFCGLGNPEGFRRTLRSLEIKVIEFREFPDHYSYTAADVADLGRWSRAMGADLILTTQKDLVKLRVGALGAVPLRALRIGLEVMDGLGELEGALRPLLNG